MFLTWSSKAETDVGFQANEDNKSCSQKNLKKKAKDLSNKAELQESSTTKGLGRRDYL